MLTDIQNIREELFEYWSRANLFGFTEAYYNNCKYYIEDDGIVLKDINISCNNRVLNIPVGFDYFDFKCGLYKYKKEVDVINLGSIKMISVPIFSGLNLLKVIGYNVEKLFPMCLF